MPERVKGKTLLFILIILAVAPFYFWSALDGSRLLTERDLSVFFIPPRLLWTESLRAGEFPLWNPYSYSGHPLFATLQPGVLYPVNLIFFFLPFDIAFNWSIVIHYGMAGCFTCALLKELRASSSGALAGGLVFMLSGYLFSVHNVMSTLFSVTWAPLAVMAQIRALRNASLSWAAGVGLIMCVMFLGGGIETAGATFMLLLIVSAYPGVLLEDWKGKHGLLSRAGLLAVSVCLFLGLSAIQLLPFLELALQSTRAGGLSFTEATTWSFDFKDLIQLFLPDPYGYGASSEKYWNNQSWLKTVYLGPVPFMLTGFYFLRYRLKAIPIALTALFFLAIAMGANTPLYRYLYDYVPYVDKIRYPVKFLFVPFLITAVLAGLGLDSLKEALKRGERGASSAIIAYLSLAVFAALLLGGLDLFDPAIKERLILSGFDYPEYNIVSINIFNAKRVLIFFMLSAGALYTAMKTRSGGAASFLLILILGADLFFAHNGYYQATSSEEYHSKSPVLEFVSKDTSGPFRVYTTARTAKQPAPVVAGESGDIFKGEKEKISGFSLEHRIFDAGGVEVMKRADYSAILELIARTEGPESTRFLKALNVKYIVSIPPIASESWTKVDYPGQGSADGFKIYQNRDFLPRFYMVNDYMVRKTPEESLKALLDKGFDPGRTVLLEKKTGEAPRKDTGSYSVEVTSYTNNAAELRVKTDRDGILVASESWYPGWKAYVDGKEAELLKANMVLRAVLCKAGEHTVRFAYSPVSFKAGALISALTLVLSITLLAYNARRAGR